MELTCRADSGVKTPADFKGKTLGVWFGGNEYPFLSWMDKLKLKTSGADADIKVLKQGFNVDPLLQKQAACISTMTYNEYWQIIDAGVKPADLVVFKYEDQGVATLEDGLYTLDAKLKDPAAVDKLARFVRASSPSSWPTSPRAWAISRRPTTNALSTCCSRAAPTRSSPRSRSAPGRMTCGTRL